MSSNIPGHFQASLILYWPCWLFVTLYYYGFLLWHGSVSSSLGRILSSWHGRYQLGGEMLILCPFSKCSWPLAGGGVLSFSLSQVRKCLTLPVALQYLKYQIVLTVNNTTIPSTVTIINNQFGIAKG